MLFLATLIAIAAMLITSKIYNGPDRRLPPFSTRKGKEARIVFGIVLLFSIPVLILDQIGHVKSNGLSLLWIIATLVAVGLPTIRFIKFKKQQKK